VTSLGAGLVTRTQVARLFTEGTEHLARTDGAASVVLTYLGTLARLPSGPEIAEWSARLAGGLSKRGLAQTFLLSAEYRARFPG